MGAEDGMGREENKRWGRREEERRHMNKGFMSIYCTRSSSLNLIFHNKILGKI